MLVEEAQLQFLLDKADYAVREAYKLGLKTGRQSVKKKCTTKRVPYAALKSKA